jgi:hypothetical protein
MATKKKDDPTVSSESVDSTGYPEGTHPARPPAETHHSATRITYKDNPDKPDPSTVAQIAEFPDDWS